VALQDIPDRLPVRSGALHCNVGNAGFSKPAAQGKEVVRHRLERPYLFQWLAVRPRRDPTGNHRPFMHIQATAALVNDLHAPPPKISRGRMGTPAGSNRLTYVLLATIGGPSGRPDRIASRAHRNNDRRYHFRTASFYFTS